MRRLLASFSLASLLLPASVFSQTQDARPADPGLTIRSSVQEVLLDVTVRDSKGRIIKNLKPGDLEIFEDGVRQNIRDFKLVLGREPAESQPKKTGGQMTATASAQTPTNPLRDVNLLCIVFVNLDANLKPYAVRAVQEFLKTQMQPSDWIGVFNLQSQLVALQPFTTNRAEVMEAANKAFTGTTVDFASVATAVLNASPNVMTIQVSGTTATMSITGGSLNPQAVNGADVATGPAANRQRGDLAGQRRQFGQIEGMREMDQIDAMVKQLSTLPGRKSVLLLSPGLATVGDPDLFKSMVDKALKADVTIYALDVNGLSAELDQTQAANTALKHAASISSTQSVNNGSAAQNMERMRESDYIGDAVRTTDTQSSLRALSESTGGFLIGSTNDFRKSFQHVIEDVDTHYEVIYHPTSDKYDGHLRSIEVKSSRPELSIESRTGYFALPAFGGSEPALFEMAAMAALNYPKAPYAFDFHAGTFQFRPRETGSLNDFAFEIPVANLKATPLPAVKHQRLHVSYLALVKDSSGQVIDKFSQDSPYELPDENMAKARATSIVFTHPLALPPGHYTIETAALDREAGTASTKTVAFDSPELKGVGLSSILLVQNREPVKGKASTNDPLEFQATPDQAARVVPELATNLSPNVTPSFFFVIYPDPSISDKPKIQAEFLVNGVSLAKQTAALPPPDATGAIPMNINMANKTGECELRITAMQGSSSKVQSLKYTIAAK